MPLYDFQCNECKHLFVVLQKYVDPNPICEKCEEPTTKIISETSFILKGDGWYRDGYSKIKSKIND